MELQRCDSETEAYSLWRIFPPRLHSRACQCTTNILWWHLKWTPADHWSWYMNMLDGGAYVCVWLCMGVFFNQCVWYQSFAYIYIYIMIFYPQICTCDRAMWSCCEHVTSLFVLFSKLSAFLEYIVTLLLLTFVLLFTFFCVNLSRQKHVYAHKPARKVWKWKPHYRSPWVEICLRRGESILYYFPLGAWFLVHLHCPFINLSSPQFCNVCRWSLIVSVCGWHSN